MTRRDTVTTTRYQRTEPPPLGDNYWGCSECHEPIRRVKDLVYTAAKKEPPSFAPSPRDPRKTWMHRKCWELRETGEKLHQVRCAGCRRTIATTFSPLWNPDRGRLDDKRFCSARCYWRVQRRHPQSQ